MVDTRRDGPLAHWLRSTGRHRRWEQRETVFAEGSPAEAVLLVAHGRVKVVVTGSGGKQVLLAVRGPGAVLGEFSALDGRQRSAGVHALTPVEGWLVSAEALRTYLETDSRAALELLRLLVSRVREADLQRLDLGSLHTTGRLASLLLGFADEHSPDGWVHLTQTELGEAIGASREATVKALRRLRHAGLIETGRSRVRVLRADGLLDVAAHDSRPADGECPPGP